MSLLTRINASPRSSQTEDQTQNVGDGQGGKLKSSWIRTSSRPWIGQWPVPKRFMQLSGPRWPYGTVNGSNTPTDFMGKRTAREAEYLEDRQLGRCKVEVVCEDATSRMLSSGARRVRPQPPLPLAYVCIPYSLPWNSSRQADREAQKRK